MEMPQNSEAKARGQLVQRIHRFLDHTERATRWQLDHVERAIEALAAQRIVEGEDHMLRAEEPHVFRAPTDFDGGDGSTTTLRDQLSQALTEC